MAKPVTCVRGTMKIKREKKYITEVVADQLVLLDKKPKIHPAESEKALKEPLPF